MHAPPRPCGRCGAVTYRNGLCKRHYRAQEKRRGNATQRGYSGAHRDRFRVTVLRDHPICPCGAAATEADHYPFTRKQLIASGLDPNDPQYGRGLCKSCHSRHTALSNGLGHSN